MSTTTSPIRHPSVTGRFYPSEPDSLRKIVSEYIHSAKSVSDQKPLGLIAPHAGYVFSGSVAGNAYHQIVGHQYDTVIVIAPSHFLPLRFASIMPSGYYRTPLGDIPIDGEISFELSEMNEIFQLSYKGHTDSNGLQMEHSLEVQLPFLQIALGDFKLVPIITGSRDYGLTELLGRAISDTVKNRNILVVASTDLSHFHTYNTANRMDRKLIELVQVMDFDNIEKGCGNGSLEACGVIPMSVLLRTFAHDDQASVRILKYANSGDAPYGSKDSVVGYLSAGIYRN